MLIPPPRTRDGRVVDAARTEPHALLVSIDRPTKPDVSAFSGEVARFEGWALSLDLEPRIRVLVDGVLEREFNLASLLMSSISLDTTIRVTPKVSSSTSLSYPRLAHHGLS